MSGSISSVLTSRSSLPKSVAAPAAYQPGYARYGIIYKVSAAPWCLPHAGPEPSAVPRARQRWHDSLGAESLVRPLTRASGMPVDPRHRHVQGSLSPSQKSRSAEGVEA